MLKHIVLERPLVVLDLETTGTQVEADRIVEISMLKLSPDGTRRTATRRLNPGIPIPPEATAVHGITDRDVAGLESFRQIARRVAVFLEGCDLCGYNIWNFDLKLLRTEFKRAEIPFSTRDRYIVDPCRIFHRRESRDLTAALRFDCGKAHQGAHGAEADVMAALLVLEGQVERYGDLPRTIPEIHASLEFPDFVDSEGKFVRREDGAVIFAFGKKHPGKQLDEVLRSDPEYLEWMVNQGSFSEEVRSIVRRALRNRRVPFGADVGRI